MHSDIVHQTFIPPIAAPYLTPVSGGTSQRRWQHAECRCQTGGWLTLPWQRFSIGAH